MMNTMNVAPVPSVSEIVVAAHRALSLPSLPPVDRALVESCLVVMPNGYAAEALVAVAARYALL